LAITKMRFSWLCEFCPVLQHLTGTGSRLTGDKSMVGKKARSGGYVLAIAKTGAGTSKTLHTESEHDCIHAGALLHVSQPFENIDQPGRRQQHSEPMRQLFFAVGVAEQLRADPRSSDSG
jgi:hypothetical protein